jgi:hypothetical protein
VAVDPGQMARYASRMRTCGGGLIAASGIVIVAIALTGCGGSRSRADACYSSNAFRRAGRAMNHSQSATADALENMRCDEIAREERAEHKEAQRERREAEREREEERRHAAALNATTDAVLAEIRRAPEVPELGATEREAETICSRERGQHRRIRNVVVCSVGGPTVFRAAVNGQGLVVRVDAYYEGQTLPAARDRLINSLGEPSEQRVTPDGFRLFLWKGGQIALTMYEQGVHTTVLTESEASVSAGLGY